MQKYKVYINNELKIITHNWKEFCDNYELIEASGGIVYNNNNELLMIYKNNKWDLPKGKLDSGENIRQCAIREVKEECGVSNLQIISDAQSTYHTYFINGKEILKRTYWFFMNTSFDKQLKPQTDEGITKVEWVNKKDITAKLENSYANIKELFLNE